MRGDAARHRARAREAPQRAHSGRRPGGRGASSRTATWPTASLPDKAVSVLDTACARLALGQNATPPAIEDATRADRRSAPCRRASSSAKRPLGADHAERLAAIAKQQDRGRSAPDGIEGALGEGARPGNARSAKSAASWKRDASRAATTAAAHSAAGGRRRSGRRPRSPLPPIRTALRAELAALECRTGRACRAKRR